MVENFNKHQFLLEFHKAYINKYINTNLHCHIEMFNTLKTISEKKLSPKAILDSYDRIKHLILRNEFNMLEDIYQQWHQEVKLSDWKQLVHLFEKESILLVKLKDIISQDAYALLNIVMMQPGLDITMKCCKAILTMKPKEFCVSETNISNIDVLINTIVYLAKTKDSKNIHKYVLVCRELLYFKGNAKNIKERALKSKIIPMMIYMLYNETSIDTSKPIATLPQERYLYVLCSKDPSIKHVIEKEKDEMMRQRPPVKNVKASIPMPNGGKVDIIKIYH